MLLELRLAVQLVKRLDPRSSRFVWFAPVCSSWCWISRGSTGRSCPGMLATLKLLHVECCAGSFVVRHAVGPLPGKENPMGWVGPSVQQGNIMIGRRGTWCDTWLRRRAVKVDNANLSCDVPNAHAWTVAWEHALSRSICCSRPALISATHQAPLLNKQQQCDCSMRVACAYPRCQKLRCCLLITLLAWMNGRFILEQPMSSLAFSHPRMQWLCGRFPLWRISVSLGSFGASSQKPVCLWSNMTSILQLHRPFTQEHRVACKSRQADAGELTVERYVNKYGQERVKGTSALKKTQRTPRLTAPHARETALEQRLCL